MKNEYIKPEIEVKQVQVENLLGYVLSKGKTGSANDDIPANILNQSHHQTGDGGDAAAKRQGNGLNGLNGFNWEF